MSPRKTWKLPFFIVPNGIYVLNLSNYNVIFTMTSIFGWRYNETTLYIQNERRSNFFKVFQKLLEREEHTHTQNNFFLKIIKFLPDILFFWGYLPTSLTAAFWNHFKSYCCHMTIITEKKKFFFLWFFLFRSWHYGVKSY